MGGHISPGSLGVNGLGALRGCADLSAWGLVGTLSAPNVPSILGSPESSHKTNKWLLCLWSRGGQDTS